jgi:PKD repeat protein
MVCLPINVAHATVQNIAVTKLIDETYHKKTLFVITTNENTYHILVEANITTVGNETLVDLSATLFNPLNETVTASARLPDTLYDAPYYNGPVEAFDLIIPKIVVDALKAVLPVVIIVALVIQVFHIIEDIIESTLKEALEELLNLLVFGGPFVYASLPWVLLKLIGDTNPDGTFDLFIPIPWQSWQLAQLYFGFILQGYYYFATSCNWWKVEEHDVHAPWPFSWVVLFSYYDATWIRTRTTCQHSDIPPSASFYWTPTQPSVDENITFVSTSFDPDGNITAYQWWLGDGNQSTTSNFTYVYPVSGVYNVTLKVTDNGNLTSNVTNTISIQQAGTAKLVVIPDHLQTNIQKGQNGNLDFVVRETLNQSDLKNVTFQAFDLKSFDNQTISSGNVSFNTNGITVASGSYTNITAMLHAPTNSAVNWYYGNITVLSDNGGNGRVFVDVYVFGPPVANFTWSPSIPKVGEQVTFDASLSTSTAGPIEDYEWNFGDGGTASGSIVTHTFTNTTIFTVVLNVTDSKGLWDVEYKQIQVVQPYGPKADFTVNPETANVGQLVTFDATASQSGWNGLNQMPITKYSWDFGDGNKTDTTTPIIYRAFSSSGIYYPTLTVYASGATPETDAITHRVVVMSVPVGGYSISLTQHNTSMPSSVYLALLIMLSAVFTTVRRKTRREKTTSM